MDVGNAKERTDEGLIVVERAEDIPRGMTEAEEAEFWSTHALGGELLERMRPVPPEGDETAPPIRRGASSRRISLVIEGDLYDRLKALAKKQGTGYQTLLKALLRERLYEEEKRLSR